MSLVGRVAAAASRRDLTLKDAEGWQGLLTGGPTRAGADVSVTGALGLIPVFASVRVLAESIHVMPCHVYRRLDRGRERASDTWQFRLLRESPNPEMAPGRFFETLMVHLNLWGNAYAEKVRSDYAGAPRVAELWPIEPGKVNPVRTASGQKRFEIEGGRTLDPSKILHIPGLGYDGLKGLSPIGVAREELGVAVARQQWQAGFYKRGANMGGVITRPADAPMWTDTASDRFKNDWARMWGGASALEGGGTPVLQDGMTYQPIGMPLRDQQFIEQGQFTAGQIANLFRVPPSMIGAPTGDTLTYGNREQDAIQFVTFSLLPWMTRITEGLWADNDLFPSRTFYPEFLPEALLKGDSAERAQFYTALAALGVLSPNDIAEMENRPVKPGGDDVHAQQQVQGTEEGDTET